MKSLFIFFCQVLGEVIGCFIGFQLGFIRFYLVFVAACHV